MSTFLIPNASEQVQLQAAIDLFAAGTPRVRLWINTHTPSPTDTPSAYTEPTWTDYAEQNPSFNTVTMDGNIAVSDSDEMTFLVNSDPGSDEVQGYIVVLEGSSLLAFVEQFDTPLIPTEGVPINLTIRYRFRNP